MSADRCPECRGVGGVHGPGCSKAPRPPVRRPPQPEEDRCPVTELLRDQCAHCRPTPTAPSDEPGESGDVVAAFLASYDGRCADCGGHIEAGSKIGKLRDGGYVCEECLG